MSGRTAFGPWALLALAVATPAWADARPFPVQIRAESLASALQDLTRQTGAELLYDRRLVRGLRSRPIQGRYSAEAALRELLSGTGLTARRSTSGAWLIERRPLVRSQSQPQPQPEEQADLAVPDILITAIRSQNADIRRRENDVQPYRVDRGEDVVRAHRDNVDQYFGSRVTANTQAVPPSQQDAGHTNSAIDLRGLGLDGTMILVDGRRMPGTPDAFAGFGQPDLNAIPLHAIDRIETLTGTAGGIYGFGALGGVVNVILRRDYRGAELHATAGISTRGDVPRLGLEGRLGFTPDGGRTDVMLYLSRSQTEPLLIGERSYMLESRQLSFALAPAQTLVNVGSGDSVIVHNFLGGPLVLKPELGGASLGARHTSLPTGFSGTSAELVAALTQRAGTLDLSLSDAEARSDLGSSATVTSGIATIRHRFGGGIEAYLDALFLRNRGRHVAHTSEGQLFFTPDAPSNPFQQFVLVTFPAPPEDLRIHAIFESARYSGGIIAPLRFGWKGTAEATFGYSSFRRPSSKDYYSGPLFPDGDPDLNPFGDWDDFLRAAEKYRSNSVSMLQGRNRYREQSLRLAGPAFTTSAGTATLILLAQLRQEAARYEGSVTSSIPEVNGESSLPARALDTRSLYAELRAPIFGDAVPFLRNLELQLAARYDHQNFDYATDPFAPEDANTLHTVFAGTAYTAGAKFFPLPWLMVRGSYATGVQPPSAEALISLEMVSDRFILLDPKRGNAFFTDSGPFVERLVGSPDLGTVKANTLSLGLVLNPFGDKAPRISLDYSRIRKTRDIYMPSVEIILAHEELWPERVVREPLTDADRALGYTGGRITEIDARAMNAGGARIESLDGRIDWTLPFLKGALRAYGAATLQLGNEKFGLFGPRIERVGFLTGPLRWRANGGADWTSGATTLGANIQYFAHYRIYPPEDESIAAAFIEIQGSKRVRAQAYVDLHASRRFRIGRHRASLDLGLVNVLDQAQPREMDFSFNTAGYSRYGDPRRRRVELILSSSF